MNNPKDSIASLKAQLELLSYRLDTVQKVAQLGFWDWNVLTGDLYWSDEIYRIFGLIPKEFGATYDAFLASVHEDDRDYVQRSVDAAVNGEAEYNIEHRIVQPDGALLYVNEQGAVTRDDEGNPTRMLGTVIDITERKLAEISRLEREAEFGSLWEATFDAMITVDINGAITLVNQATEDLFGYDRNELIGSSIEILLPHQLRNAHVAYRNAFIKGPRKRTMGEGLQLEGCCKNGDTFSLEISLTPVKFRGRQEVLVEIQDITKRKVLELQLNQSSKMNAIGELTGSLAHDLNNMLGSMLGYTEIAMMGLEGEKESIRDLQQVMSSGGRAKNMISQMLAFSRQQVLQLQLIDINESILCALEILKPLIPPEIEIISKFENNLGKAQLDPEKFEQVIINLIVNARDAIEGAGKIIVATRNVELDEEYVKSHTLGSPGHYVELSVTDTGSGMTEEVRNKIFEPFFTTKPMGKGTGLGLSTAYGIVKQSKGDILVSSELGQGAAFQLYFPVTDIEIRKIRTPADEIDLSPGVERILLVDDDAPIRKLGKRILESNGYAVVDFESAEEVLERKDELGEVDLLVTDIILKGVNGIDFASVLRSQYPEIKILYMSGYVGRAASYFSELPEYVEFLPKPFTRNQLLRKVKTALHKS